MFHEGSVIQQGTHEELLADEGGKYYELWHAQAQYYMIKGEGKYIMKGAGEPLDILS